MNLIKLNLVNSEGFYNKGLIYMLKLLKRLFTQLWAVKCPECNEPMVAEFLDMKWDRMVYKCKSCNKRWM